jgi:hypothetical protein
MEGLVHASPVVVLAGARFSEPRPPCALRATGPSCGAAVICSATVKNIFWFAVFCRCRCMARLAESLAEDNMCMSPVNFSIPTRRRKGSNARISSPVLTETKTNQWMR